jgi:hypothetical protein
MSERPEIRGTDLFDQIYAATSRQGAAVAGQHFRNDTAIWGHSDGGIGVHGDSKTNTGVHGHSAGGFGVHGHSPDNTAVIGTSSGGSGVHGYSTFTTGVFGYSGNRWGIHGHSGVQAGVFGSGGIGVEGKGSSGIRAEATGIGGYGLWAVQGPGTHAGLFSGDVQITGTLKKGGGGFSIDHPLAPAQMYLNHAFVESSEMKNVYDGVVQLDENGAAQVDLPPWFEALNGDFRYQLTAVGGAAPNLHVAEEISENRFRIAGGEGGMRVCWQVTGTRKDAWATANTVEVEEEKPQEERGRYLHPDLYNAPEEQGIGPPEPPATPPEVVPTPPEVAPTEPGFDFVGLLQQLHELRGQIEEMQRARVEDERQRQLDELRGQIEELRRRGKSKS